MSSTKPQFSILDTTDFHPIYFNEFSKKFNELKNAPREPSHLALSGLLLYCTFEHYLNWLIRYLLEHVNRRDNRRMRTLWEKSYKNKRYPTEKLTFFKIVFLAENIDIENLKTFTNEMAELRNMLAHGSEEYSHTYSTDSPIKKSKFAQQLTFEKVNEGLNHFLKFTKDIVSLIRSMDVRELTPGIDKEGLIRELTFPGEKERTYLLADE